MIVTVCSHTCPSCADSRYNDDRHSLFSDLSFVCSSGYNDDSHCLLSDLSFVCRF